MIKEALDKLHSEISEMAAASGRRPEDIQLLPVSKTKPMDMLLEAYQAGERVFGENRIKEACEKKELLPQDAAIDFIGHIQSNKASMTPGKFRLIHSLDSLKLARKLDRLNKDAGLVQSLLIEVNCSGEESKGGYRDDDSLFLDLDEIFQLESLSVEGLMTMAPWVPDEVPIRKTFSDCRELRDRIEARYDKKLPQLSMGMTNDYHWGIEEGSTLIRIGTAIFGNRQYP